jgi:dynactin complex subunit
MSLFQETGSRMAKVTGADIGKRVSFFSREVEKNKSGTLQYFGCPEFTRGDHEWCGIKLDKPEGKNNGTKNGIKYFTCKPAYGVFVRAEKVRLDTSQRSQPCKTSLPSV